jgi:hypothetical protein
MTTNQSSSPRLPSCSGSEERPSTSFSTLDFFFLALPVVDEAAVRLREGVEAGATISEADPVVLLLSRYSGCFLMAANFCLGTQSGQSLTLC